MKLTTVTEESCLNKKGLATSSFLCLPIFGYCGNFHRLLFGHCSVTVWLLYGHCVDKGHGNVDASYILHALWMQHSVH